MKKPFLEFPLLKRELIALLRTRRAFWLLVLTVAASSLLALVPWPSERYAGIHYQRNVEVFLTFIITQLIVCVLVIPAFTAGAISGERERSTYELLYSTLLSPLSIVFSKVVASTGYVLLLLIATAPLVCVLYLLGGIAFATVLKCFAVTFAAVVSSGIICLTVSMRSRRTVHAVLRGFLWVIVYNVGILFVLALVFGMIIAAVGPWSGPSDDLQELLFLLAAGLCPVYGVVFQVMEHEMGGIPSRLPVEPWLPYVVYAGLLSLGHGLYLLRKVRLPEVAMSRRRERLRARARTRVRRVVRPLLVKGLMRLGVLGFPLVTNPIFQKEIRVEFFGRRWYRHVVFWVSLGVFLLVLLFALAIDGDWATIWIIQFIAMGAITLLVLGTAATSVGRESDQGNLDFLRGTLVPLSGVLRGKVLGSLVSGAGIVAAAAIVELLAVVCLDDPWPSYHRYGDRIPTGSPFLWGVVVFFVVTPLTLFFSAALGTFAAVVTRRSLTALLLAYISVLIILVGLPIFLGFIYEWDEPAELAEHVWYALNPFVTYGVTMTPFSEGAHEKVVVLGLFVFFYGLGSLLLLVLSSRLFDNLRERDR